MDTEDQQNRIDDYLRGRSADAEAFERELANDPQLAQEMEATRLALNAIELREEQQLKDRLRLIEARMKGKPAATAPPEEAKVVQLPRRSRKPTGRRWFSYAAAAALLLFLAGYFFLRPAATPTQLALAEVEAFENIAYTTTRGEPGEGTRARAYAAYDRGDYAAARAAFRELGTEDPVDAFYYGQTLLEEEAYGDARDLFDRLATTADFQLAEEAAYYAAVARLGVNDLGGATERLQIIAGQAGHASRDQARELLDILQ
jgi:TolA-binding protein